MDGEKQYEMALFRAKKVTDVFLKTEPKSTIAEVGAHLDQRLFSAIQEGNER